MTDESEIIKEMREEEKLGRLHGQSQGTYEELEFPEELPKNTSDESAEFFSKDFENGEFDVEPVHHDSLSEDLSANEKELLFQITNDLMLYLDLRGRITKINRAGIAFSGFSEDEMIGQLFWKIPGVFSKRNILKYLKVFKNTIRGEPTENFLSELHEKSGKKHVMVFSTYPVKENNKVASILVVAKDVTEQKETENRYHLIIENTSDLVTTSTFTLNPIFTYASPAHKKAVGYEAGDLIGKPLFDFVHPDDKRKILSLLKKYLSAKAKKLLTGKDSDVSEKIEIRSKDKSGNWHYMETTANLIGNEIVSVSRDVTDRKKAEEAIRNSEEKYRTLAESAPVGISVSNAKGVVFEVNPTILKIFGYDSKEEFLKISAAAHYYDQKDRGRFTDLFKQGFVKDFEARFKRKDGNVFWGSITSTTLTTEAESTMFINVFEDITTRLKTEEKLRESEKKYSGFFKTSRDATFLTSKDGRLIESNNAFIELLGYETEDELLKSRIPEHYENPKDRKRHIQTIERQGFTKEFPVNLRKKDGSVINTLITSVVIKDENGDVTGFQGTIRDITERKKAEEELKISYDELGKKVDELERYKNVTVGRELRIIELKKKIKQLEGEKAEL